jgi:hypothetical protein
LSHTSSLFCSGAFGDGVFRSICVGWPGMSHQCLAMSVPFFFFLSFLLTVLASVFLLQPFELIFEVTGLCKIHQHHDNTYWLKVAKVWDIASGRSEWTWAHLPLDTRWVFVITIIIIIIINFMIQVQSQENSIRQKSWFLEAHVYAQKKIFFLI